MFNAAVLTAGLSKVVDAARFERDFFNGTIFRDGPAGEVVIRVVSDAAADVLKSRYGRTITQLADQHAGSVRYQAEPAAVPAALRQRATAPRPLARVVRSGPTLADLITSSVNRLAIDAAHRLAAGQLPAGSVVCVYGGCGLGKTHLASAVAETAAARPGVQARVISGEQFANEFIGAVKSDRPDRVERFRRQYRTLDVFCLDDVQALQGKQATQHELQHTIDAVVARGGRVLVCAAAHPRKLTDLAESLVSRLMGGLVAELTAPDAPTAARIVQALAGRRGLVIEGPAAEAIACAAVNDPRAAGRPLSVRDLEGLVTKVEAVHRLLGSGAVAGDTSAGGAVGMLSVNRALADGPETLRSTGPSAVLARIGPRQPVRLEQVVSLVCQKLGVVQDELAGRGRHPRVVLARAVATLLARRHTRASYPEIARALGRPNHSTVITAHQRLQQQLSEQKAADCGDGRGMRPIADLLTECSSVLGPPAGLSQPQTA